MASNTPQVSPSDIVALKVAASIVAFGTAFLYAIFALGTAIGGDVDDIDLTARYTLTLVFLAGSGAMLLATVTAIFWARVTIVLSAIPIVLFVGFAVVADWHGTNSSFVVITVVPAGIVIVLCRIRMSRKQPLPPSQVSPPLPPLPPPQVAPPRRRR
jgi:hypothetical protein